MVPSFISSKEERHSGCLSSDLGVMRMSGLRKGSAIWRRRMWNSDAGVEQFATIQLASCSWRTADNNMLSIKVEQYYKYIIKSLLCWPQGLTWSLTSPDCRAFAKWYFPLTCIRSYPICDFRVYADKELICRVLPKSLNHEKCLPRNFHELNAHDVWSFVVRKFCEVMETNILR